MKKHVFGVSDQVRHKPGCMDTEDGKRLDILDLGSRAIILIIRLSELRETIFNPEYSMFMCDLFLLNCRLQIEQVDAYCDDSDVDPFALSLRSLCFLSASQILFASYWPAPFLMRQGHSVQSCAACSQESVGILKSLNESLRVSL